MNAPADPAASTAATIVDAGMAANALLASAIASDAARLEHTSPFKGESSFGTEDEGVFFGRDGEAKALTHRILSSRMTVLHAPSGAGKTSLLNARIIPNLEREGWMVVRTRPENHPARAIQSAVVQYLFPPYTAEIVALRRGRSELGVAPGATWHEFLDAYKSLDRGDPRLRSIIASPSADDIQRYCNGMTTSVVTGAPLLQGTRPLLCRVLSSTMDWTRAFRHWALYADPSSEPDEESLMSGMQTVDDLERLFTSDRVREGYATLLSLVSPPIPGLLSFFRNLTPWCLLLFEGAQMVLLMDQFEEIFTRFQDQGRFVNPEMDPSPSMIASGRTRLRADWRLRREFFGELGELYAATDLPRSLTANTDTGLIPIRFVVSLRDEYVARLGPLRRFATHASDSPYRLELLSTSQAKAAIEKPIEEALTQRSIEPACVELVIKELQLEDEFVEPGPLQLVCQFLWKHTHSAVIGVSALQDETVGGVRGVLARYFRDAIATIAETFLKQNASWSDEYVRLELLDLLSLLVTSSGTRNVVEKTFLVDVPYRHAAPRQALLDILESHRLVRKEVRMNEEYYEVTHEFLLAPIQFELQRVETFGELTRALSSLRHALDYPYELMDAATVATLHQHRALLAWDALGTEVMYRNAVAYANDQTTDLVRFWSEKFAALASSVAEDVLLSEANGALTEDGQAQRTRRIQALLTRKTHGLVTLAMVSGADPEVVKTVSATRRMEILRSIIMSGRAQTMEPFLVRLLARGPVL